MAKVSRESKFFLDTFTLAFNWPNSGVTEVNLRLEFLRDQKRIDGHLLDVFERSIPCGASLKIPDFSSLVAHFFMIFIFQTLKKNGRMTISEAQRKSICFHHSSVCTLRTYRVYTIDSPPIFLFRTKSSLLFLLSTAGRNWSVENLQYLTSEQALADLANFIVTMNATHQELAGRKWIVFGGMYILWRARLGELLAREENSSFPLALSKWILCSGKQTGRFWRKQVLIKLRSGKKYQKTNFDRTLSSERS